MHHVHPRAVLGAAATLLALLAAPVNAQNQGLSLQNGVVTHADIPFAPTLVPQSGITAEAWITYDESTLGPGWRFPTILRMDPSANQASYFLRVEAGQTRTNRLLWWVSTPNGDYSIGYTFTAGAFRTWTHVAGTYDGATLRLFVNGAQVAQGVGSGAIHNRGGTLRIGNGDTTVVGGETWNGEIDEVRVWPFACPAAAILAAKDRQLGLLPSEVSTWNLNGDFLDSSGTNHGAGVNAPTFAPNTLTLTPHPFGGVAYGAGSGCTPATLAGISSPGFVGNAGFGFGCARAPASANGLFVMAVASLPLAFPIFGIDLWVDVTSPGISLGVASSAIGGHVVTIPVPADPSLGGFRLHAQYLWLDNRCPTGVTASNGITGAILP